MDAAERRALILGCAGAVIFFALVVAAGLHRSYDYDESVTVANFVRRESFWDAVTTQVVFNNHPAFTALAWTLNAMGRTTEAWIRLPAALAGAASVGLLGWACARRWGALSAAAAMAIVVANPLFIDLSRQARGYSIAALAVLATTLLLPEVSKERSSTTRRLGYAALVAIALLAHLYAAIAVAAHGAWVMWHRRESIVTWIRLSVLGGLIAAVVYAPMLSYMAKQSQQRQGEFDAAFPIHAASTIFGNRPAAVLGVMTVAISVGLMRHWWASAATVTVLLAGVWIGVKPYDLYPRFLVWLVPLGGLLVAAAMSRSPKIVAPPLAGLLLLSTPTVADLGEAASPIRSTAIWVDTIEQSGRNVCFFGYFSESYEAYLDPVIHDPDQCDVTLARRGDVDALTAGGRRVVGLPMNPGVCGVLFDAGEREVPGTTPRC